MTRPTLVIALISATLIAPAAHAAETGDAVSLSSDNRSEMAQAIERQFVIPMTTSGSPRRPSFRWGRVDIDRDGYDELIVQLTNEGLCNEAGCPVVAFRKAEDGHWPVILTTVAKTLSRPKDGPAALVTQGDGPSQSWRWDAKSAMLVPTKP